jgi:hypothetical protein
MGGTPNGLKQFFAQGRTTIKKHVFPNCLRSSSIMEGEMDFHAWVGSEIYSWMFFCKKPYSFLAHFLHVIKSRIFSFL